MNFADVKKNTESYKGSLILDSFVSRKHRHVLRNFFTVALLGSLMAMIVFPLDLKIRAIFLLLFSLSSISFLVEFFFNSYYFRNADGKEKKRWPLPTYELSSFLFIADEFDATKSFLESFWGRTALFRVGFFPDALHEYLHNRKEIVSLHSLELDEENDTGNKKEITVFDFAAALIKKDAEFANVLFHTGIQKSDFLGAVEWTERRERAWKHYRRWWGKENLAKIPGLAKDWAYGSAYILQKYEEPLTPSLYEIVDTEVTFGKEEVILLEEVLERKRQANAIIIGNEGGGEMDVVYSLSRKIEEGKVLPSLEHRRIVVLNTNALIDISKEKTVFEGEFVKVLDDALLAGNIIVCFADFASFIQSAKGFGSDVISLLSPYLESDRLKVIALSESSKFHQIIEPHADINRIFEKIFIKDTSKDALLRILEHEIEKIEFKEKIFFTFQSLKTIEESAERYLSGGMSLDSILDLLYELIPEVKRDRKTLIRPEDVSALIQRKTGIPQGEIEGSEKDKLLHLEEILHKRIVGQNEAVSAVAAALRRARSGLANSKKPIGSFLFLGPTGVGKTETTKALAEVFFGSEDAILRLDMSEYKTADALDRLIGSSLGHAGTLASKAREKPYGVVLLDEFEKTSKDVLNLFLSILDEGFFSDAEGKRVNLRNMIIIATSNAGSDAIRECIKNGEKLEDKKLSILDDIIESGIFKPELLNRFDGIILFHPLHDAYLENVAKLLLEKFASRLFERGVVLDITPELVNFLLHSGVDPQFGARSMNRVIADTVETLIADKMIAGEIKTGSKIQLLPPASKGDPLNIITI